MHLTNETSRLLLIQYLKDNLLHFFCAAAKNDDHIFLVISLRLKLKQNSLQSADKGLILSLDKL